MSETTNKQPSSLPLLVATGLVAVPLAILAYVYLVSSADLRRQYAVPLAPVTAAAEPAAIAEGERLARIRGCFWCHGEQLEGRRYFVNPDRGVRLIAPNLTEKAQEYSDAEFARAIRHGVRRDGTGIQPAMPSFAYYHLSDVDVGRIIGYIRSLPVQKGREGEFYLYPLGRLRWVAGRLPPFVPDLIDHDAPRLVLTDSQDPIARGRYLAETVCTECHGDNGRIRVPGAPDLNIVAAYTRSDFVRLMRTGVAAGEREIDYHMVEVAKYRYHAMQDEEIDALYTYFIDEFRPDVGAALP